MPFAEQCEAKAKTKQNKKIEEKIMIIKKRIEQYTRTKQKQICDSAMAQNGEKKRKDVNRNEANYNLQTVVSHHQQNGVCECVMQFVSECECFKLSVFGSSSSGSGSDDNGDDSVNIV